MRWNARATCEGAKIIEVAKGSRICEFKMTKSISCNSYSKIQSEGV